MFKFLSDRVACLRLIPSTNNNDKFYIIPLPSKKNPYLLALENRQ